MKRSLAVAALLVLISATSLSASLSIATGDWEKAVSLYKQGQFRDAIAEFQKVVAEFPEHSDSWKFIGLAYYQLQDYKSAIAPLEKSLAIKRKEGRNDPDLFRALGQAQIALRHYDQALPYFETLVRAQANVAANFYMLGVTYANLNRAEEASEAFNKALKLDPKDGESWHYLGVQYFRNGRLAEAVAALRSGLSVEPKNTEMMGLLAESLLRQGGNEADEKKAAGLFDEATRIAMLLKGVKEDAASLELLGRAYLAAKRYANAEQTLSRALETSKQPSTALYFNLGFALAQTKAWTRAAEMLAQADKLTPGDVNTLYYLGYVYENLRRYPQALEAYTRAYEAGGRSNSDLKASIDRVGSLTKQP